MARCRLCVCTDAVRPKGESLASAIASSNVRTRYRQVMGPKSSLREISSAGATFSIERRRHEVAAVVAGAGQAVPAGQHAGPRGLRARHSGEHAGHLLFVDHGAEDVAVAGADFQRAASLPPAWP